MGFWTLFSHRALLTGATLLASASLAHAQDEDFYRGKQVRLIVGTGAGGSYDTFARILQPILGEHLPGKPKVIVENMQGASGLKAANYMATSAPKDGTVISMTLNNIPTAPLLTPNGAPFDATKFNWIGSVTHDRYIGYVWHTSPVKTLADLKTMEVTMGAEALGGAGADVAVLAKSVLGLKIKMVLGYPDSTAVKLAMEKGELEGTFANALGDIKSTRPQWLRDNLVRVIVQHGAERIPEFANVPSLMDIATNDADRQALNLLLARQEFSKPVMAPPGVPAARVAILRRAFDASVADADFVGQALKAGLTMDRPMTGEDLSKQIAQLSATPPAIVQRVLDAFKNYQ